MKVIRKLSTYDKIKMEIDNDFGRIYYIEVTTDEYWELCMKCEHKPTIMPLSEEDNFATIMYLHGVKLIVKD